MNDDHSDDDTLCDRRVFVCEEGLFRAIAEVVDAPPKRNDRLRRLLSTIPPWEMESPTWDWN